MRRELLRCFELLAVECRVMPTEIHVGILAPNPTAPPDHTATLYDTTTEPPTPYPVTLPASLPPDKPSYRAVLPRIQDGTPL